ncbi:MAG: hypothetical protein ACYC44_05075 [Patescibacteria group bacterium]
MDNKLWRDCILKGNMRVDRAIKISTMLFLRLMALDHPRVFGELVRHCRSEDSQPPLSKPAIKFLIIRGMIPIGQKWLREDIRQIILLAVEDNPRQPREYVIVDPELRTPWSPSKT